MTKVKNVLLYCLDVVEVYAILVESYLLKLLMMRYRYTQKLREYLEEMPLENFGICEDDDCTDDCNSCKNCYCEKYPDDCEK